MNSAAPSDPSVALLRYLELEDSRRWGHEDAILDEMDEAWLELSDDERAWLDDRHGDAGPRAG
jgi:hypothetical protein